MKLYWYGCKSWTIKKAGCRRIGAFELCCWRPLDCKEIKPVNPKGDQSWIFIKGLMLKLKLQYFGHLMWRTDSLEKILILEKTEGRRRRGWKRMSGWMASLTQWTWVWASSGVVDDRKTWCAAVRGVTESRTWLSEWTEMNWSYTELVWTLTQYK